MENDFWHWMKKSETLFFREWNNWLLHNLKKWNYFYRPWNAKVSVVASAKKTRHNNVAAKKARDTNIPRLRSKDFRITPISWLYLVSKSKTCVYMCLRTLKTKDVFGSKILYGKGKNIYVSFLN